MLSAGWRHVMVSDKVNLCSSCFLESHQIGDPEREMQSRMLVQQLHAEPLRHQQLPLPANPSHSDSRAHRDSQIQTGQVVKAEILGSNPGSTVSPQRVVVRNTMRQRLLRASPGERSLRPLVQGNSRCLLKVTENCPLIFQASPLI